MFKFRLYKHRAQILLRQPGNPPVTLLIRGGLTQGDPLSMVLCGITLIPLVVGLRVADPGILTSFYSDDMAFYGL